MKFVEFEDSDTGETISIRAERVDAVYKAAQPGDAIMRIAESIVRVKGTRAEVVAKLEAASGMDEKKERVEAAEGRANLERFIQERKQEELEPGALPTEPGFYEYRWKGISDPQDWIPVEVVETIGGWFVLDPNTENNPALYTYSNAEWRKRKTPE